ncbi:hypothetical protein VD172_002327 [Enterococcus faecium]|nr:hypothetical protein [Enterococcus faecium]
MDNVKVIDKILDYNGDPDKACDVFEELGFNMRQAVKAAADVKIFEEVPVKLDKRLCLLLAIREALDEQ